MGPPQTWPGPFLSSNGLGLGIFLHQNWKMITFSKWQPNWQAEDQQKRNQPRFFCSPMKIGYTMTGWWFGCHFWHFPIHIGNFDYHPNWRSHIFQDGVAKNHQPVMEKNGEPELKRRIHPSRSLSNVGSFPRAPWGSSVCRFPLGFWGVFLRNSKKKMGPLEI